MKTEETSCPNMEVPWKHSGHFPASNFASNTMKDSGLTLFRARYQHRRCWQLPCFNKGSEICIRCSSGPMWERAQQSVPCCWKEGGT